MVPPLAASHLKVVAVDPPWPVAAVGTVDQQNGVRRDTASSLVPGLDEPGMCRQHVDCDWAADTAMDSPDIPLGQEDEHPRPEAGWVLFEDPADSLGT